MTTAVEPLSSLDGRRCGDGRASRPGTDAREQVSSSASNIVPCSDHCDHGKSRQTSIAPAPAPSDFRPPASSSPSIIPGPPPPLPLYHPTYGSSFSSYAKPQQQKQREHHQNHLYDTPGQNQDITNRSSGHLPSTRVIPLPPTTTTTTTHNLGHTGLPLQPHYTNHHLGHTDPLLPPHYTNHHHLDASSLLSQQRGHHHPHPHLPPLPYPSTAQTQAHVASSPPPPSALINHLARQNDLIRDAWKAEREHLEANRSRAEEVYQEERAIMDAMQDAWEVERTALLGEMRLLKERVRCLEMENRALRSSPPSSTDASAALGASYRSPADPSSLPPGLDGAARRPHHRVNIGTPHGAASSSSSAEPAWSSVLPLDPRMQPQTRNPKDFLARDVVEGGESDTVIDIHEVDPKLEGIPLRATAVQRLGFFGGQQSSRTSAATSPPTAAASGPDADTTDDPRRLGLVKRNSSRDTTIQVLHAAESRRLTMYAGHTPNHSLSLFPTMSISATRQGSAAASRGPSTHGLGTPPQQAAEEKVRGGEDAQEYDTLGDERGPEVYVTAAYDGPPPEYPDSQGEVCYDDGGGGDDGLPEHLEPIDDVRLKGPLMVKNIPAQDEIFWDQVNKKLEPISQGKGALPAAMMGEDDDDDDDDLHAASSFSSPPQPRSPVADVTDEPPAVVDGENSPRNHRDDVAVDKNIEPDVPLKIRSTTNFGAPFGVV